MNASANSPETPTTSTSTFSPFSQASRYSYGSEAGTSDEPADLGQFTTIFRALTEIQTETRHNQTRTAVASSSNGSHHRHAPSNTSNTSEFSFSGQSSSGGASSSLARSSSYRRTREGTRNNTTTPTASTIIRGDKRQTLSRDDNEITHGDSNPLYDYLSSSYNHDDLNYRRGGPPAMINASEFPSYPTSSHLFSSTPGEQLGSDHEESLASETEYDREENELSLEQTISGALKSSGNADQPSLGWLDSALDFIAAEREKHALTKKRDQSPTGRRSRSSAPASSGVGGGASSTNESALYSSSPRRRKRRRKRGRHPSGLSKSNSVTAPEGTSGAFEDPEAEVEEAGEEEEDGVEEDGVGDGSSSEPDNDPYNDYNMLLSSSSYSKGKSLPTTPPRVRRTRRRHRRNLQQQQIEESSIGLVTTADMNITTKAIKEYALFSNSMDKDSPSKSIQTPSSRRLLAHSRSTPSLRSGPVNTLRIVTSTTASVLNPLANRTLDPRVFRLRTLATKLRILFSEDAKWLNDVLRHLDSSATAATTSDKEADSPTESTGGVFIDPRGRPIQDGDPLIHIFIDHSNILIGFLHHLRKYPPHPTHRGMKTHLSHAALALVLERGRPIARRVLATSSPLYQPMDSAERLGYEVRVYIRVPDNGDGADRSPREHKSKKGHDKGNGHPKRLSLGNGYTSGSGAGGGTSAESDSGGGARDKKMGGSGHTRSNSFSNGVSSVNSTGMSHTPEMTPSGTNDSINITPARIRYREQGVDELLQLKLLQVVASTDDPPRGSTIVLATGDGNVGQFNEEGFLGCVRTALKKGWCVELYAWELGLSRAWAREFGNGPYRERFRIIGLERYAEDLMEVP